jgi:hypothetical protein
MSRAFHSYLALKRRKSIADSCRVLQQVIPDDEDEADSLGDKAFASPKKPALEYPR